MFQYDTKGRETITNNFLDIINEDHETNSLKHQSKSKLERRKQILKLRKVEDERKDWTKKKTM